jgi:transposase
MEFQFQLILAVLCELNEQVVSTNINDTDLTIKTVDKIPIKIIMSRKYPKYLIADKGYVSIKNKNNLKNKIILV